MDTNKSSKVSSFESEKVETKIYLIRGMRVMLDFDLAELYGVDNRSLRRAVRRNPERFPPDFFITLTNQEVRDLMCQIGTSTFAGSHGGSRYAPYAFTQEGVSMLSGVLRSDQAIQVNIAIMRAFVKLKNLIADNQELARKIAQMEKKYDGQFKVVFDALRELMSQKTVPRKRIIGLHRDC